MPTDSRFTYSSMTTPAETYDYDKDTRTRTLRKRQEIPSGHNPTDYVTRRVFAPAPRMASPFRSVDLLFKNDTPLDGSAPLFLYGYGSYGTPSRLRSRPRGFRWSTVAASIAIAHIRGGKDKGYNWYTDGKLDKKINTSTDFIAVGEHSDRGRLHAARAVSSLTAARPAAC